MDITLAQLLEARDRRRCKEMALMAANPRLSLTVVTVNIPGSEKRTPWSVGIGREALRALEESFGENLVKSEERDLETGYEAYILADLSREEAKRRAIAIEETHPLGRLMDIDVLAEDCIPLSRAAFGGAPRRCLLCGDDARVCMRLRRHDIVELRGEMEGLWHEYVRRF